jgi:hypothetical protein
MISSNKWLSALSKSWISVPSSSPWSHQYPLFVAYHYDRRKETLVLVQTLNYMWISIFPIRRELFFRIFFCTNNIYRWTLRGAVCGPTVRSRLASPSDKNQRERLLCMLAPCTWWPHTRSCFASSSMFSRLYPMHVGVAPPWTTTVAGGTICVVTDAPSLIAALSLSLSCMFLCAVLYFWVSDLFFGFVNISHFH